MAKGRKKKDQVIEDAVIIDQHVEETKQTETTESLAQRGANNMDYDHQIMLMNAKERKATLALADNLNVDDLGSIRAYGSELSSIVSSNGNAVLESVRGTAANEVVESTTELLCQLRMLDPDDLRDKGPIINTLAKFPVLRKFITTAENFMTQYDTVKDTVDNIEGKLKAFKQDALRDNEILTEIGKNNLEYREQLQKLILGLKLKIEELKKQRDELKEHNTDPLESQKMEEFINSCEKRLADMIAQEAIVTQSLFQIQATQSNNLDIANKAEVIATHVIPTWKQTITMSLIMDNQKKMIQAQDIILDFTNEQYKKLGQTVKENSIANAKANERPIIAVDTIKSVNNSLKETLIEVGKIKAAGAENRKAIEATVVSLKKDLVENVLTYSANSKMLNA